MTPDGSLQYHVYCMKHEIFTKNPCPKCKQEDIDKEIQEWYRSYEYSKRNARPYEWRTEHKRKQDSSDKIPDTYFESTAQYCIVPWIRNPEPKIIPDRKFHEWYQDMKDFRENYPPKFRRRYKHSATFKYKDKKKNKINDKQSDIFS